jgi:hypothetical protein
MSSWRDVENVWANVRLATQQIGDRRPFSGGMFASGEVMLKGFNLQCAAGKTARVWQKGKGGVLSPGVALVLHPPEEGETEDSVAGYITDLRTALIDGNNSFINVVVCESDYRALKRGIGNLESGVQ